MAEGSTEGHRMCEGYRMLDISVDINDIETGTRQVLQHIRPEWKHDNITYKFLSGGAVNTLLCCFEEDDIDKQDAIVIRIYTIMTKHFLFDHDLEIVGMRIAHETRSSEPLYAIFTNGMAYKYATGRCLSWSDVQDKTILKLVAETLAKFHSNNQISARIKDRQGNARTISKKPVIFSRIYEAIKRIPNSKNEILEKQTCPSDYRLTQSEIKTELRRLEELAASLRSPIIFCHNDIHAKNLIYDEKTGGMSLVDFDCCSYNYAAADLANLFCTISGMKVLGLEAADSSPVSDELIRMFASFYLSSTRQLKSQSASDISQQEIQQCFIQIKTFMMILNFHWGTLSLSTAINPQDSERSMTHFDFWKYSDAFMSEYSRGRESLFSTKLDPCP